MANSQQFDPESYQEAIQNLCDCEDCVEDDQIEIAYNKVDDVPLCNEAFRRWCFEGLQEIQPLNQTA